MNEATQERPAIAEDCAQPGIDAPRSVAGWRRFAREVGVVVLGVLLALGAEQVARAIDDARKVRATRAIATQELETGFQRAQLRIAAQACTLRRMDEIGALLAEPPEKFVAPLWIGRPPFADFVSSGWNAAEAAGQTALLNETERTGFGGAYNALRLVNQLEQEEQRVWAELRQLESASRLDPMLLASARSALQQARLLAWQLNTRIVQSMETAKQAGIRPPSDQTVIASTCLPMTMTRAEAVARMNAAWGDDLGEP